MNRVSSAVWPTSVRRVVATGKAAQRRRDWIMQRRWWVVLADALSLRVLCVLTTLLVVSSSLLVALLGLQFWYLLLLPLLLFALTLLMPAFLASRMSAEVVPPGLSTFAQEFRSSAGLLSLHAQELKSSPGYFHELRSNPGLLAAEAPATPMPADPPLVRVLVTYDLRKAPIEHFLEQASGEETGEYPAVQYRERDFWRYTAQTELLEEHNLAYSRLDFSATPLETDGRERDYLATDPGQVDESQDDLPAV